MTAPQPHLAPMPLDDALAQLLAQAQALGRVEAVDTLQADGRVLAEDVVSPLQVPAFDNSAMDGYALRMADLDAARLHGSDRPWPVSQRIAAGQPGQPLAAASVARIFTGAPIPAGADAVLMQEDCQLLPEANGAPAAIRLLATPRAGQWIRRAGEDVALGATVLARGQRLDPAALGLAASVGRAQLQVAARPRVALFSTGDELVMPGHIAPEQLPPGAIYNTNRFVLRALLQRLGCTVSDLGQLPDQREATRLALQQAAQNHDVILSSGGVSVGEEDHIKPAVQALGRLELWQIAIKPGKPFAYGQIGACHVLGLPGNPVSSFVTFLLLVRPFLNRLQGGAGAPVAPIELQADFDWPRPDRRREFLRVRRDTQGRAQLFPQQSSGVLTSMVWGDGLLDNPPGQTIARGDRVRFLPFEALLT